MHMYLDKSEHHLNWQQMLLLHCQVLQHSLNKQANKQKKNTGLTWKHSL